MKDLIYFSGINIHGAVVVYGVIGIKQYYGYTEREAREKYKNECKGKIFYEN